MASLWSLGMKPRKWVEDVTHIEELNPEPQVSASKSGCAWNQGFSPDKSKSPISPFLAPAICVHKFLVIYLILMHSSSSLTTFPSVDFSGWYSYKIALIKCFLIIWIWWVLYTIFLHLVFLNALECIKSPQNLWSQEIWWALLLWIVLGHGTVWG